MKDETAWKDYQHVIQGSEQKAVGNFLSCVYSESYFDIISASFSQMFLDIDFFKHVSYEMLTV